MALCPRLPGEARRHTGCHPVFTTALGSVNWRVHGVGRRSAHQGPRSFLAPDTVDQRFAPAYGVRQAHGCFRGVRAHACRLDTRVEAVFQRLPSVEMGLDAADTSECPRHIPTSATLTLALMARTRVMSAHGPRLASSPPCERLWDPGCKSVIRRGPSARDVRKQHGKVSNVAR